MARVGTSPCTGLNECLSPRCVIAVALQHERRNCFSLALQGASHPDQPIACPGFCLASAQLVPAPAARRCIHPHPPHVVQ